MHVELTEDKQKLVATLLDFAYQDLREEIAKTETGMRDDLTRQEATLRVASAKLGVRKP